MEYEVLYTKEANEDLEEIYNYISLVLYNIKAAKNLVKTKEKLNRILAANCGKDYETLVKDTDRDNWMSAEEAMAYGLVDKVIDKR